LKSKFPLGKKPKEEEEESEEIEDESESSRQDDATGVTDISERHDALENKSLIHKLKSALNKKAKSDESQGDDAATAAKKKKSKIIQLVIVVAVILIIFSDDIIPPEEPVAAPVLKPRPRPNKKRPVEKTAETSESPSTETVEASTGNSSVDTSVTETANESPVEVTSTEIPNDTPVETSPENPPVVDETPVVDTPTLETPPVVDIPAETSPEGPVEDSTISTPSTEITDSVDGNEATAPDENITDQILEDLEKQAKGSRPIDIKKEYVSPPDYDYRGRGLVYNCKGKHWACVDAPSYKTCEDNSSSVKYLNKKTECYPFNIYETERGCGSMQNRMVSSSAKTNFCNE
jgi:hypothetical protein